MDGALMKKILLRGAPPLTVVVLMLYYTFYVGNNADKLRKEKERQRQEQVQPQNTPDNPPVPPKDEVNPHAQESTVSEQKAATPQEEQTLSFEQVFTGDFWSARQFLQWQKCFLAFADEAANGVIPLKSCGEYRSEIAFSAEKRNGEWRVSSQSAERYEKYVTLICALETDGTVQLFLQQRGTLDALLQEMGFAGLDSLTLTRQALAVFADMPVPDEDPALIKGDGGIYIWKDEELERLSPIRKLCLRMGVENARQIKAKATEILAQLN